MLKRMARLARVGWLLREVRGLRQECARLASAVERIAEVFEQQQALEYPAVRPSSPADPLVEVSYVETARQAEWMEIEMGLTAAKGTPPTEEDILQEWERRHPEQETPSA